MTRTASLTTVPADPAPLPSRVEASPPAALSIPEDLSPDLRLVIEKDSASDTYVYKTVNRVTGEVLQQFPRDQILQLRAAPAYQPGQIVKTGA